MNFFVTGDGSVKANVSLKFVTPAGSHGTNFADNGQSLSQSFLIAQEVFGSVNGKIDFAIIGLAPDCLFQGGDIDKNLNALNEYLKLCVECGAKPVAVIFPVASSIRGIYRKKFVTPLREILAEFKKIYDFELVDMFDLPFHESYFTDEILNSEGANAASTILTFELYERKIFSLTELRRMSYEFFSDLSCFLPANVFHELMNKIFRATIAELRRKDKIKIAFVTDHAATWCGDELYNFFVRDKRFEPTIFMCRSEDSTVDDTRHDVEQFKEHGLNVVGVFDLNEDTPHQDIVIFLRPYLHNFPKNFQLEAVTPQTLWTYITYGFKVVAMYFHLNHPIFRLAWKIFFTTEFSRKFFDAKCLIGMPRGVVSGYPKMDIFFEDTEKFSFPWKKIYPDAKKIIWAPHWSFQSGKNVPVVLSTFNYNFKFMYEFAKAHPETSWVVKPHPRLAYSAVKNGLFPSNTAFEKYLQAWDELPNAQVFTGGYYQPIFATSDGLILDSGSFVAEYQFTHKPIIYLTREDRTKFTEPGEKILDVSYCVDGRDLDGIAALMQKIFIDGDDPLKDARQQVFDELLNYRRINGMSASEYIFRNIADDLGV